MTYHSQRLSVPLCPLMFSWLHSVQHVFIDILISEGGGGECSIWFPVQFGSNYIVHFHNTLQWS